MVVRLIIGFIGTRCVLLIAVLRAAVCSSGCLMNLVLVLIPMLSALLWQPQTAQKWVVEEKRGAVEVYAEFDPNLPAIWGHLQDVQNELASELDVHPSGASTQIILFSNRARFMTYLVPKIPEARSRKAIFYKNGDVFQIYAFRSNQLITDLRHEYTHAILHQHLAFLPLWLDEGLAEYLEEPAAQRNGSARLSGVKWKSRVGWSPSLNALESLPAAASMTEDDYRDSWAWVTFLLTDSETTRHLLKSHIQTISRGEAPPRFSQQLRQFDPSAEKRINSYFRKFRFPLTLAKDQ